MAPRYFSSPSSFCNCLQRSFRNPNQNSAPGQVDHVVSFLLLKPIFNISFFDFDQCQFFERLEEGFPKPRPSCDIVATASIIEQLKFRPFEWPYHLSAQIPNAGHSRIVCPCLLENFCEMIKGSLKIWSTSYHRIVVELHASLYFSSKLTCKLTIRFNNYSFRQSGLARGTLSGSVKVRLHLQEACLDRAPRRREMPASLAQCYYLSSTILWY
jgi:hypothetical protein